METDEKSALEPTLSSKSRIMGPPDRLVGSRIKHFDVVRLLGKGGMGAVYLAHDMSLDRQVALKVLAPEIAHDAEVVERFVREARTQARLRHPNVAQIYFIGEEAGLHFFVMEYVEGDSISQALEREKRLPWEQALELVIFTARGLRAAAAQGFIHRDVKPSNLMLDPEAGIKILDFGLVKKVHEDSQLTREGAIVGSPLYMSPEQGQAKPTDLRSDVYSLGCSLYHMVTGRPPFVADSAMGVVAKHITEEPTPVRELAPEIPETIERLLERMMAKDPGARFQTHEELIEIAERARPDQRELFGFRRRAFALGIDLVPFAIGAYFVGPVIAVLAFAYFLLCHRYLGRTLGKWIFGLEVTDREGRRLSWKTSTLRMLVFAWGPIAWSLLAAVTYLVHSGDPDFRLSQLRLQALELPLLCAALVLVAHLSGFLLAAFHPKKLALHDLATGTEVRYRANPKAARVARMIRSSSIVGASTRRMR